nr:TolC family outer membrane protein [Curvibacter sp. CHRR-16]
MDIYEKARTQDAQFQASRNALQAALEKLPQARAGLLPTVSLSANKNRQFGTASFSGADAVDRDAQSWSWSVQLTQPLIRWANWVGYQQANAATRQAMAQFSVAEQDLVLRVAQAYMDVLVATQGREVMLSQSAALEEQLTLAQRTYSVGTGTITDVHEATAKLAQSQAQAVAATQDLEFKRAELERMVGESVGLLDGTFQRKPYLIFQSSMSLADWLALADTKSMQIQMQQAALEVANKEVAKSDAAHLPTLDMVLSKGTNYSSGSLSSPADIATHVNSNQVGLQMTIPLYAGGATQSRVREALALAAKAQDELTLARRTVANQVRQAHSGILSGQAQIAALQTAVEAARNAVESNKIGLRIGTRITPDVLSAEQQLYASMRDLSKAHAEMVMHHLKLKAASGTLTQADLMDLDRLIASDQKLPATLPTNSDEERKQ